MAAIIFMGWRFPVFAEKKPDNKVECARFPGVLVGEGHRHANGGGVVGFNAKVSASVFVDKTSCVLDNAVVSGNVRLEGHVYVSNKARINGTDAEIRIVTRDNHEIFIKDSAKLKGRITISLKKIHSYQAKTIISGHAVIDGENVSITDATKIGGWTIIRGDVSIEFANIKGYYAKHPLIIEQEAHIGGKFFPQTGQQGGVDLFGAPHIEGRVEIAGWDIKIFDQATIGGDAYISGNATIAGCTLINHGYINSGHHETPCADKDKLSEDPTADATPLQDENPQAESQE